MPPCTYPIHTNKQTNKQTNKLSERHTLFRSQQAFGARAILAGFWFKFFLRRRSHGIPPAPSSPARECPTGPSRRRERVERRACREGPRAGRAALQFETADARGSYRKPKTHLTPSLISPPFHPVPRRTPSLTRTRPRPAFQRPVFRRPAAMRSRACARSRRHSARSAAWPSGSASSSSRSHRPT